MPNRSKKLKTRIIANSICPLWKEELVLTSIPVDDLTMNSVLELTVWDYNKRHSNDFLGGVRLGPFTPTRSKWMDCLGEEVEQNPLKCDGTSGLNKGHIGTSHFVLCGEVVEVENVLVLWEREHLGP